jgi:transcriptional regulator with GAF, ATPase, and Fis domain
MRTLGDTYAYLLQHEDYVHLRANKVLGFSQWDLDHIVNLGLATRIVGNYGYKYRARKFINLPRPPKTEPTEEARRIACGEGRNSYQNLLKDKRESDELIAALHDTNGVVSKAARKLGYGRRKAHRLVVLAKMDAKSIKAMVRGK